MKIGLILTNDWELYGDGSGDYFEIQHKPMLDMLDTIKSNGSKITIMAEVGQQFAHLENSGNNGEFIKITEAWQELLKKSISTGNDVQLHFHPQWIGAKYQNNRWELNMSRWVLPALLPEEIEEYLTIGKKYLEDILQPVNQNYECILFRAGALCIQPSEIPIEKMKKSGFIADSSVTQGEYSEKFYDFRDAPSNLIPWYSTKDIIKIGNRSEGILEMPIYTFHGMDSQALKKKIPELYYKLKFGVNISNESLNWQIERERIKQIRYPKENRFYKKYQKKDVKFYLNAILSKGSFHLDYDYLPPEVFVKILKNIIKENRNSAYRDSILPVIALGHIKDVPDSKNIERILRLINSEIKTEVVFWTMTDALDYWKDKAMEINS